MVRKICLLLALFASVAAKAQNPYLPLWEHLPDGEPRVFEDPDQPGKYRVYIIGSHDTQYTAYCGNDVRMWSAPVEDLSQWRDEGPIFTWQVDGQWDTMYAPDLVEIKDRTTGKKTYWLYPHSRGWGRTPMVCKGDRPNGPFKPVNLTADGKRCLPGSLIDFDPSVFVENITDKKDRDYKRGFRAYVFYGFRHSTAYELDPDNMYAVRPGTEVRDYFLPASERYGIVRDPAGTQYPALYKGQNPGDFNFFEASSIRQVGNKYVMVFSGYSGPDYGLGSTNSALRYAYGDTPMGPWRSGGVLVDSRGVVPNEDGTHLIATNAAHNTHGSLQEVNGQWYVFYHRPPRGYLGARQAMVAPVKIVWDKKPVAKGGKVTITGYDPYAKDNEWKAEASDGNCYRGAEVTSEGFQIFGLPPYRYYSAGIACYMTGPNSNEWLQDNHDVWDNGMVLKDITDGGIVGFKYFGFGGLAQDTKGIKAFEGIKPGDNAALNLFLKPTGKAPFRIKVMMQGGKELGVIEVQGVKESGSQGVKTYLLPLGDQLPLTGKHAIYLVVEGKGANFTLHGIGFSKQGQKLEMPVVPTVKIMVDGRDVKIPSKPLYATNANGLTDNRHYQLYAPLKESTEIKVVASDPGVKTEVLPDANGRTVKCTWKGETKYFHIENHEMIDNPMLWADVPDPDVIRVGEYYYLVSTTMHLMPGAPVMRSKDLANWEIVSYIYDRLTDSPKYDMLEGTVYGRGQWATSLKYHKGKFYALFAPNEGGPMGDTYIYTTEDPTKEWTLLSRMRHFHDCSLFFDDDDRVYVVYGTGEMCELKSDLSDVIEGSHRQIFQREADETGLLEGSRMLKYKGKYYLLMISQAWGAGRNRREVCYRADNIQGPYEKKVILETDFGGFPYIGQGTIVDAQDGKWYGIIFQDRDGIGRVLTVMPCQWKNGWPILGDEDGRVPDRMPRLVDGEKEQKLLASDDFTATTLDKHWQWNHNPVNDAWSLTENPGSLRLKTSRVVPNLYLAPNTLTQRMVGPTCSATAVIDLTHMKNGDRAGLAAFNGDSGILTISKDGKKVVLNMSEESVSLTEREKAVERVDAKVIESVPLSVKKVWLRIDGDFRPKNDGSRRGYDLVTFYYSLDGTNWTKIGSDYKTRFDYRRFFMGTKYALFCYATKKAGGYVDIEKFEVNE